MKRAATVLLTVLMMLALMAHAPSTRVTAAPSCCADPASDCCGACLECPTAESEAISSSTASGLWTPVLWAVERSAPPAEQLEAQATAGATHPMSRRLQGAHSGRFPPRLSA